MGYYGALNVEKTQTNIKCVFLSEISQYETAKYCVISTMWYDILEKQTYGDNKKISNFLELQWEHRGF